eukprot:ANDGO_01423.mRNA.1 ER-derived vesicles protein ERV15
MPDLSVTSLIGYLLCFFLSGGLSFLNLFYLLSYSDLEQDAVTPMDLCSRVNLFRLFEYGTQALIMLISLFTGHWFFFLVNIPITVYNGRRYLHKSYLIAPIDVFRRISMWKKDSLYWMLGHIALTLLYLVALIVHLVSGMGLGQMLLSPFSLS